MNLNIVIVTVITTCKNMLFRNEYGNLEELNLHDYKNDTNYYVKLKSYKIRLNEKTDTCDIHNSRNNSLSKILFLIEKGFQYKPN